MTQIAISCSVPMCPKQAVATGIDYQTLRGIARRGGWLTIVHATDDDSPPIIWDYCPQHWEERKNQWDHDMHSSPTEEM